MARLSPAAAFAVATAGIATFTCMDALMKGLTLAVGTYNALLWRNLAGLVLGAILFACKPSPWPQRHVLKLHVQRGVLGAVMAVLFFWGLARVPMAQAVALAFVAPLFALLLAALMLGETIGRATILASAIAFAGILVIFFGQAQADLGRDALLGSCAILCSALCYALNLILMRRQSQLASPIEVALFQSSVVCSVLLLAAPWLAVPPALVHAPAMVGAAALALFSSLCLSWAYAHAQASYLAATEYTAFLWAAALGFLVFGEAVSPFTLAGAALIVAGCFYAMRRRPVVPPELETAL